MPKATRPLAKSRAKTKTKPKARPRVAESELGDRRRLALLEAAYELTAEKGLAGLRTRDVAARAKVNISTLHYYFGTKQELITELVNFACAKFEPSGATRRPEWVRSALSAHLADSWAAFAETPKLEIVLEELSMHSRHNVQAKAAFRAVYQGWNAAVAELMRAEVAAGRLRADLDPRRGAFIVTSFIIGASVELGVDPRAFDYGEVAVELERWASALGKK
jgi:AcrR family transcriptional regulator